mmetsp:Transcript_18504/g.33651  ORF Transcript_18504/g.33651 Transcript_18504/m.33651 type:complete len:230 (+) Transcript_18504:522-1211(+)
MVVQLVMSSHMANSWVRWRSALSLARRNSSDNEVAENPVFPEPSFRMHWLSTLVSSAFIGGRLDLESIVPLALSTAGASWRSKLNRADPLNIVEIGSLLGPTFSLDFESRLGFRSLDSAPLMKRFRKRATPSRPSDLAEDVTTLSSSLTVRSSLPSWIWIFTVDNELTSTSSDTGITFIPFAPFLAFFFLLPFSTNCSWFFFTSVLSLSMSTSRKTLLLLCSERIRLAT